MGFSEDLSEGGLFLSTLCPPSIGEEIELSISGPDGVDVQVVGRVRWIRYHDGMVPTGCGVEFINVDREKQHLLEEMIITLRKEPLFFEL